MDQPIPFRMPHRRVLAAGLLALLALGSGCDASSDAPPLSDETAENSTSAPAEGGPGATLDDRDAPPLEEEPKPGFSRERLEQLVAPVALYPDQLLMDVLMAATYPVEVEEAGAWVKANPTLTGKALDDAIAEKGWDVSVNSLVHATQALELMTADPQWTRDLGDAFLAQQDDVLNAVQVMRTRACDLGNLKTNDKVKVEFEDAPPPVAPVSPAAPAPPYEQGTAPAPLGSGGQQQYAEPYGQQQYAQPYGQQVSPYYVVPPPTRIVRIVPVQPNYMYVPVYNPRVIYGPPPPVTYYPQVVAYPQATVGVAPIISFGLGLAIGSLFSNDCDWHSRHVYRRPYGSHYHNDPYWYRRQGDWRQYSWRHDEHHRRNVSYRRPEYGNVREYRDYRYDRYERERRKVGDPRAWQARENQMRLEEDRLRREQDKRWRERDKQMRKDDDRRAKDDRRDWQQQQKGDDRQDRQMRKDEDRHRRDDDQRRQQMEKQLRDKGDGRAKEDDRAWKQQQKPQGRDDRPGAASGDRQDKGGRPDKGDRPDKDNKSGRDDKGVGKPSKDDRGPAGNRPMPPSKNDRGPGMSRPDSPSKKDDRGPAMGRPSQPSPKGGGREQDRGGSKPPKYDRNPSTKPDRGPSTRPDRGSSMQPDRGPSMKPDRGGSPSQGGGDRGGYGGQPSRGGSGGKGISSGQPPRGGSDRGGSGGKSSKPGGGDRGGDSGKGGGKDKANDKNGGR